MGLLCFLGLIFGVFSYLIREAVGNLEPISFEMALEALDQRQFDEAKSIVGKIQQDEDAVHDFGRALFVLGVAKADEAENEWSGHRQRAMYLVAARYLRKALMLGIPDERIIQAKYLLGLSLIRGNQPTPGVAELEALVGEENIRAMDIHGLLVEGYRSLPQPDYAAALRHNQLLLDSPELKEREQLDAQLLRTKFLGKLGQFGEARKILQTVAKHSSRLPQKMHVSGRLALQEAQNQQEDGAARRRLVDAALADFDQALRLDGTRGVVTRETLYFIGVCHEVRGDPAAATTAYDRLSKQHPDSSESLAASFAKARLAQAAGDAERAIAGYRLVLERVRDPITYKNALLTMPELRRQLLQAQIAFLENQQFEHAIALIDQLQPAFDAAEVTELRGGTQQAWGKILIRQAADLERLQRRAQERAGRYHLRIAGRALESLAHMQYATPKFTEHLWQAADNYFQGQSFTHAARVLQEFLYHETRKHQAMALLRLGQSQLALRQIPAAVATLEECLELYPGDAVVYQARLECCHAHVQAGNPEQATQILLQNINGNSLKTTSPEWRDSLFALGELYLNTGDYEAAIDVLDEAVRRYADAPQALMGRYNIAISFHNASKKPAEMARVAKTESERQKNRKLRDRNLEEALRNYALVQRILTKNGQGENDKLDRMILRNCYMMQGSVLFQLKRYQEARKAYSNISTLYVNEPFVLESFVHIANCWRRLDQPIKAKGAIEQAKLVLQRFPPETDFKLATNFNREQWKILLNGMSSW